MDDVLTVRVFRDRLATLMEARKLSERELCDAIGKSHGFLRHFLKPGGPTAKKIPNTIVLGLLADALNVAPEQLVCGDIGFSITPSMEGQISKQAERIIRELSFATQRRLNAELLSGSHRPTTGDVMNWLQMTGNKIHKDTPIWNFADLHEVPEPTDKILRPGHVGEHSLAALRLGAANVDLLSKMMGTLTESEKEKFMMRYHMIKEQPIDVSHHKISISMPEDGISFDTQYERLLREVEDGQGNKWVLCYASIPAEAE